jgi:hypothetical protein
MKFKLGNLLSIILVVIACSAVAVIALGQVLQNEDAYQSNIRYSFTRLYLNYDYSCDENVYGLYVDIINGGNKMVQNLSVSVTNELCVGSIPPLANALDAGQSIKFYIYTTEPNGTVSVTGNNTDLVIRF